MKRKIWLAALLGVLLAAVAGYTATPASAATAAQNTQTTTVTVSNPTVTVNGKTVSAQDIKTGKVVILSYVKAKGLSHKEKSHAKKMEIGAGTSVPCYWNSGVGAGGKLYWFRDCRRTTAYLVNGQWRKGPCGNFLRFTPPHRVVKGRVIMVRSYVHVLVTLHAMVSVYVQDTCGHASASSEGMIKIKLSMLIKAHGSVSANMFATLVASLTDEASASISCGSSASPPLIVSITTINDVDAGGNSPNFCATVWLPKGDTGTLTFSATYGHFTSSGPISFTVSGDQSEKCATYYAPSEVPNGGNDTVTVTLVDDTTGTPAAMPAGDPQSFPINPPPPTH